MSLKELVGFATAMRNENTYMLDVSKLSSKDAAFITELMHNDAIYNFFVSVQDIPVKKLVAACKFLEAQELLRQTCEA